MATAFPRVATAPAMTDTLTVPTIAPARPTRSLRAGRHPRDRLRADAAAGDDHGLLVYDPAFMNTASCISRVTYIDGDRGILMYRGYPIEELAEHSTYLETAYLLVHGELPTRQESEAWVHDITMHTLVHENVKKFIDGFHHDAHPWAFWCQPSAHCRPSIPTQHESTMRSSGASPSIASSPRCRRWRRSRIATHSASRTTTRTMSSRSLPTT